MRASGNRDYADRSVCLVLAVSGLRGAAATEAWRLLCLLFLWQRTLSARATARQVELLRSVYGVNV
jgi:hypothetical protein